jgi:hypothetical protein
MYYGLLNAGVVAGAEVSIYLGDITGKLCKINKNIL